MSLIRKITRYDKAVYWPPVGADGTGEQGFGDPVEIGVRWEDVTATYQDRAGNSQTSKATVYVDRDVEELGCLWHGKFADLTDLANPFKNPTAWEIKRLDKIPKLRNNEVVRVAYLADKS